MAVGRGVTVGCGVAPGLTSIPVPGSALPGEPEAADDVSLGGAVAEGSGSFAKRPHATVASITSATNTGVKTGADNPQRPDRWPIHGSPYFIASAYLAFSGLPLEPSQPPVHRQVWGQIGDPVPYLASGGT